MKKRQAKALIVILLIIVQISIYAKKVDAQNINPDNTIGVSKGLATSKSIPSKYDLRNSIKINVEEQKDGICWAFASLATVRTYLAKNGYNNNTTPNLSEWHINYLTSKYYKNKYGGTRELGAGGSFSDALKYFGYNNGPILESKFPIGTKISTSNTKELEKLDNYKPEYYVHETISFPSVTKKRQPNGTTKYYNGTREITTNEMKEIRNSIKTHIMNNGGLYTSIRTNNNFIGDNLGYKKDGRYSQYDDGSIPNSQTGGHAVTIVGWDDNYDKNKFYVKNNEGKIVRPSSNGAYLVLNSYGSNSFEKGYQWFSYEDAHIEYSLHGVTSVNKTPQYYTYKIENSNLYKSLKERIKKIGYSESNDNTKTLKVLDLPLNELKSADLQSENLTDKDFNMLGQNVLPKLQLINLTNNNLTDITILKKWNNLKGIYLNDNKIEDINPIKDLIKNCNVFSIKHQKISKTIKNTNICQYPSIFTEAKNSSSKIYSNSGLEFTNCKENSDGKGIKVIDTTKVATVKIKSGNASGTIMTITAKGIQKGDINKDGQINIQDVLALRRYISAQNPKIYEKHKEWGNLTEEQKKAADVNEDRQINIQDVLKLRRYIAAKSNIQIYSKHPDWLKQF